MEKSTSKSSASYLCTHAHTQLQSMIIIFASQTGGRGGATRGKLLHDKTKAAFIGVQFRRERGAPRMDDREGGSKRQHQGGGDRVDEAEGEW